MIGQKKLGAVRQELRRALDATGDDPIRWLEQRMIAPKLPGDAVGEKKEILDSLLRFLKAVGREKGRTGRTRTKK